MLQNNNLSMATTVETFIIEETSELLHDNERLDKWNSRVLELELQGQQSVRVAEKSPIPFLFMNAGLIKTFETLCPKKVDIKSYDRTPIPVEILDLVAMSVNEQYFTKIEIWSNEKNPDPVCVGYVCDPKETGLSADWYAKKYLIGRWADVKASLGTLVKNAKQLFILQQTDALKMSIKQSQRALEDLEHTANDQFGMSMPSTPNLELPF